MPRLVLASTSRYRRELLERLRLPFEVARPETDETALPGESPLALSIRLAEAKARAVAAQQAGDAWAGKHIGIQLESTIPIEMTSFANWDFDNVRLTAVPEPTWLVTLLIALSATLFTRRHRIT